MKKLVLVLAVAGIVSLTACKKKGEIRCKKSIVGFKSVVTINDTGYKQCTLGLCTDYSLDGYTKEEYAKSLESDGYKCKY